MVHSFNLLLNPTWDVDKVTACARIWNQMTQIGIDDLNLVTYALLSA